MKYDLKDKFKYTETKECNAIEFRMPKGKEAQKVYNLLGALTPLAEGKVPENLADATIDFVNLFGSVVGDVDFPIQEISEALSSRDILEIAQVAVDNFT